MTGIKLSEGEARPTLFNLHFLGSIEVNQHKGNDVLCQAINKVGTCLLLPTGFWMPRLSA